MLTISVIIPARNDGVALADAIASIDAQQEIDVLEICVAVGPSDDGTMEVATQLAAQRPNMKVVTNPSGRTPDALNIAIAETTGDVIVRVDARSVLPERYIADALETMKATGAANVGAIQLPVGTSSTERVIASAMRSRVGSGMARYRHATQLVKVDTAYLGVFRRTALLDAGAFDSVFTRNQDSELNIRLGSQGHEVWLDPRLVVNYTPRGSLRALTSQYFQYGWWRARTVRKHPGSLRLRQILPTGAVAAIGLAVVLSVVASPVFLLVPASYLCAIAVAALLDRSGLTAPERGRFAAALIVMHLSWGSGFIISMVRAIAK